MMVKTGLRMASEEMNMIRSLTGVPLDAKAVRYSGWGLLGSCLGAVRVFGFESGAVT
jgi:hypothetical protein